MPPWDHDYAYDPAGNRTSQTIDNVTTTFSYNANSQLTTETTTSTSTVVNYTYDDFGNVATRKTYVNSILTKNESFEHDYFNRIAEYAESYAGVSHTYAYWPTGDRYEKRNTVTDQAELYVPTAGDVSADYSQSGTDPISFQATYVNGLGIDQKATRIASGGTRTHFMGDQVGSVTSLLDNQGIASNHLARDLFGNLKAGSSSASRYGFQQREVDSESGWMNFRNRMYDPRTGRFGGVDRVLNNRATEQYLCVANNPLSFIDPMGDRWKIKKGSGNAGMLRDLEIYTGRKITVDDQGYVWFGGSNGGKQFTSAGDKAWIQGVQDDSSETDVEQLWCHIVNGDEWHREQFKAAWLGNSGLETSWQAFKRGPTPEPKALLRE